MDWSMFVEEKLQHRQRQTCKVCDCSDKFDFHVSDELWERVVPPQYQKSVVCLDCFDDLAFEKKIDYSGSIDVLHFAGDRAVFRFRKISAQSV
jgi:nitrate/TMAO reductase-like tetraheme cytochrome c subunit